MMSDDDLRRRARHVVDNCDNDWSDAADLIFAALKAVRRETREVMDDPTGAPAAGDEQAAGVLLSDIRNHADVLAEPARSQANRVSILAFAARVRREERERCMKAICFGCEQGWEAVFWKPEKYPGKAMWMHWHPANPRDGMPRHGCSAAVLRLDAPAGKP